MVARFAGAMLVVLVAGLLLRPAVGSEGKAVDVSADSTSNMAPSEPSPPQAPARRAWCVPVPLVERAVVCWAGLTPPQRGWRGAALSLAAVLRGRGRAGGARAGVGDAGAALDRPL